MTLVQTSGDLIYLQQWALLAHERPQCVEEQTYKLPLTGFDARTSFVSFLTRVGFPPSVLSLGGAGWGGAGLEEIETSEYVFCGGAELSGVGAC